MLDALEKYKKLSINITGHATNLSAVSYHVLCVSVKALIPVLHFTSAGLVNSS